MSLAFTMRSLLKLLEQYTIFVSACLWLDVNSVFNLSLFILYVTSLELNITFPFSFERTWSCWMLRKSVSEFSFTFCVFKVLLIGHIFWAFSPKYTFTGPLVTRFILSCCFKEKSWLSHCNYWMLISFLLLLVIWKF